MPAPTSSSRCAWSNTATRNPFCAIARAAVSPPMPAPAMRTVRVAGIRYRGLLTTILQSAFGRAGGVRVEGRVIAKQRRAIRTDDLGRIAHIEEHMRMV